MPSTGLNEAKVAVTIYLKLLFSSKVSPHSNSIWFIIVKSIVFFVVKYPKVPPSFELIHNKGLDDDQLESIRPKISELLKTHFNEEAEEGGQIFSLHEDMRELLSEYNDTLKGRCSVCLDAFCNEEELQALDPEE